MRFETVVAYAFGPLRDERLELAPGLNVVFGPNEAGKSSWHAALYAGLCGMRRGRGMPRKEEKAFADRHKPWGNDDWEVGAVVALEDGRRIELRHDLAGRVDSSALDVNVAGRDYSTEIIHDGAPDGSRWLGLNRRAFLYTACVRQADILKVRDDPRSLQEDMQRAAATAGADATAAAALQRLDEFLKERVGSTRAPTKPLVRTERETADAREALESAREAQREYLRRRADVEDQERAAREAESRVDAMEAAIAEAEANQFARRLHEAQALDARFPEGAPHPLPGGSELHRKVTEALTTWNDRPVPQDLEGPSARELAERIDRARGDLLAARAVVAETRALDVERRVARARELGALFPEGAPRVSAEEEAHASDVLEVLHAWDSLPPLREPAEPNVEQLELRLADFDRKRRAGFATSRTGRSAPRLIACGAAVVAGTAAALLSTDLRVPGLTAAAVAAVALLWFLLADARSGEAQLALVLETQRDSMARSLAARRTEQARYEAALEQRAKLVEQLIALVPPGDDTESDPERVVERLREWEASWRAEKVARTQLGLEWDELQGLLGGSSLEELAAEGGRLRAEADGLIASVDESRVDRLRARGVSASELAELERQVDEERRTWADERAGRLAAEERRDRDAERIADAAETLSEAAAQVGVAGDGPDELSAALEAWREHREGTLREAGRLSESWDRLQQILGERTLEEFAGDAERLRGRADRLARRAGSRAVAEARESGPTAERLETLRSMAESARSEVDRAHGRLTEREQNLPSVADAEDALAAAERARARVARLKHTLDSTIAFLQEAQERVLRDIAPILTNTILEWLSAVTHGRYTGCRIDPESLLVEVRADEGRWRDAELLSHGTAEQIYLLLRFALSRHLTREGETCPLILDDVVAASDAVRKEAVLRTLQALGASTQIILFTHEEDVRDWAKRHLHPSRDRLIELAGPRPRTT
ncbi:AAA family ATPase [Candidatus Palauibacter sp.]|uniref:AAA family ATPase n=1 Tax=Candidatus Palauibacter sp. TaxID=3101350 RepID=UPI003B016046